MQSKQIKLSPHGRHSHSIALFDLSDQILVLSLLLQPLSPSKLVRPSVKVGKHAPRSRQREHGNAHCHLRREHHPRTSFAIWNTVGKQLALQFHVPLTVLERSCQHEVRHPIVSTPKYKYSLRREVNRGVGEL